MYLIAFLTCIPIVIWALMEPLGFRFSDFVSTATSIGQVLGLIGMSLFSINLILAARFKFLDKYFKGLDKVYINHHKIGAIAFSMLLFHPIFLVVEYITISLREASLFFVPFVNMPITWGIISLVLMIIILAITFYARIKYHIWKMSHKFMIVVFVFAILHTFLISSDISRNGLLRYYILSLAFIGLILSARKALFDKILVKKFRYKINNINNLNENMVEVEMESVKAKMVFESGQFAFFSFISKAVGTESHPFSIASSDKEGNLKIIFKNLGDFTNNLKNIKQNDEVLIDGPYGYFPYKKIENKNQIWIAGGIGITPFLGMTQTLESDYNIDLFYSVKEEKESIYQDQLNEFLERNKNFRYNLWESKNRGYLKAQAIVDMVINYKDRDILLCGPASFVESLKTQFVALGVDIRKIHYENFSL